MGPLVPDFIGNELNFLVALIIGILFGAILEQAGFSTSKKLVGLFYGYDFTVLRVFFTAGIVGMVGVIALTHFGLLDINLVYINPTFLWSAIVGGLIMGLGFVIGGFCPGTSFCAAAIGKIDAMIFILGSFLGVFIFAEGYPFLENFYKAENWGFVRIFDVLGMSQSLFAFLLTAVALLAFWGVSIIEDKTNKLPVKIFRFSRYYLTISSIGIIIALSVFFLPERKIDILKQIEDVKFVNDYEIKKMSIDEFAFRLIDDDNKLQVIDFRNEKEHQDLNLPKSFLLNVDNLFEKNPNKVLSLRNKINVIVAEDEITERKIAVAASMLGYKNIKILQNGLKEFRDKILNFNSNANSENLNSDTIRFRTKASKIIPELIASNKGKGIIKTESKRVIGGC